MEIETLRAPMDPYWSARAFPESSRDDGEFDLQMVIHRPEEIKAGVVLSLRSSFFRKGCSNRSGSVDARSTYPVE